MENKHHNKKNTYYSRELEHEFSKAQIISLIDKYFEDITWSDYLPLLKQLKLLESRLTNSK